MCFTLGSLAALAMLLSFGPACAREYEIIEGSL